MRYQLLLAATAIISLLHRCPASTAAFCSSFPGKFQHELHRPLFSTAAVIHHLDDSNMRQLLFSPPSDSPSAVLVDAYTQWCGPCKLIDQLIQSTANKYATQLSVLKYDVEGSNNQQLKIEMLLQGVRVSGLPTLILYWRGKPVVSHSGVISEGELEEWLDVHLFSNAALEKETTIVTTTTNMVRGGDDKENKSDDSGGKRRGFVSFASQYGRDDYAL